MLTSDLKKINLTYCIQHQFYLEMMLVSCINIDFMRSYVESCSLTIFLKSILCFPKYPTLSFAHIRALVLKPHISSKPLEP